MTTENSASKDEQIKAIAKCAKELSAVTYNIQVFTEMRDDVRAGYGVESKIRGKPVSMTYQEHCRVLIKGIEAELVDMLAARDALIHKLYAGCKTLLGPNEAEPQNPTVHDWMT